jgi:prepilin-type processing-associated H-X9-DG protein
MVTVFPYFEEGVAYAKFDQSNTFWIGGGGAYNNNLVAVNGYFPGVLSCPSSPLPVSYPHKVPGGGDALLAETAYVGIVGGAYTKIDEANSALREWHRTADWKAEYGPVGGSGMLALKKKVRIGQCSDGTSKTMIVGEHSNFTTVPNPVDVFRHGEYPKEGPGEVDLRPTNGASAFMGNSHHVPVNGPGSMTVSNSKCGTPNCMRCYNMTTMYQYSVNEQDFVSKNMGFLGCNRPLKSTHPGGAMTLFTDGHVDFLSDATTLQILNDFANRDDGNATSQ